MPNKKFESQAQLGEDESLFFEIPDDLMEEMGWVEGDTILVTADGNTIKIEKISGDEPDSEGR